MKKILLIDGHSILNRAFYAIPGLTSPEGRPTNAVFGFLNILYKVLDQQRPDGLAVAFDLSAPTFRRKEYAAYKGTRRPMPDELKEQVPLTREVLGAMNIPVLSMEGFEADDILGSFAKQTQAQGLEAVILSGDRDLLQLADEHITVSLVRTAGGTTTVKDYTPAEVLEDFGVTPAEIIELKALMGDQSDNIPGLPGVGEKTAASIIGQYHSIENAHAHAAEVRPPRASRALQEHYDSAVLSKWLATIRTDLVLPEGAGSPEAADPYTPEAYEMFRRLGFRSLLKRFPEVPQGAEAHDENENTVLELDGILYAGDLKPLLKDGSVAPERRARDIGIARYLLDPLNRPQTFFGPDEPPRLMERLEDAGMTRLYEEIEMPLVRVLADMETRGIRVDAEKLRSFGDQLKAGVDRLEEEICSDAGERFNLNSPKQLGTVLFEKLQLPGGKKTKSGYSTSADVLEKLAPDHPVVRKILEYRQLAKLYSTYAVGLGEYIAPGGRIHGTFNQPVTATGRLSSTDPNLQNIPVRTEMGSRFREVFVPEEGFLFVDADYSQIELRVLAAMADDAELKAAYENASDIHAITASRVFGVPLEEVTPQMRRNAKAVNFGIVYGISAFGLSEGLSISRRQAQEYINNYFRTYPSIKQYLDGQISFAKEHGYVTTMFGRRRPIPELKSGNFMQRQFGERVAMNSPIQGTAADIMKLAMLKVDEALRPYGEDARIVLQIHDELLVEVREELAEEVRALVEETMKHAAEIGVTLEVDAHTGSSWLEAK